MHKCKHEVYGYATYDGMYKKIATIIPIKESAQLRYEFWNVCASRWNMYNLVCYPIFHNYIVVCTKMACVFWLFEGVLGHQPMHFKEQLLR